MIDKSRSTVDEKILQTREIKSSHFKSALLRFIFSDDDMKK